MLGKEGWSRWLICCSYFQTNDAEVLVVVAAELESIFRLLVRMFMIFVS